MKVLKYVVLCIMCIGISCVTVDAGDGGAVILFTHDLHDNYLSREVLEEEKFLVQGGYARLYTAIQEERDLQYPTILVDAGDFSMGTVFQTIYEEEAPGLRLMGMMGYDAITFGNHEFDFRDEALAKMLMSAKESGDTVPTIVASNINQKPAVLEEAMNIYGVLPYTIIEKQDIKIGVFGLMGKEAISNIPLSQVTYLDQVEAAEATVRQLKAEGAQMIVCLSHSGTWENFKKSEDEQLAKAVPAIDLIISGHTHTKHEEAIRVGDTWIVSSGRYGAYLGKVTMQKQPEGCVLTDYELIPIDESITPDATISEVVSAYQKQVEERYLSKFGFESGEVLGEVPYHFEEEATLEDEHRELRLGNMITDAYIQAVKEAEGQSYVPVDVAVVPVGVIRGSLTKGAVTVEEAFNLNALGKGMDGVAGYPLVSAYLTGKELRDLCEVDASVAPLMKSAQLYMAGLHYAFNPNRLIFNKVTDVYLVGENGLRVEVENDKLYRIIAGLYSAQMLSIVGDQSFGILSIEPKDESGQVITDFEQHLMYNQKTGEELKEWVAVANYIQQLSQENSKIQWDKYEGVENRKVVEHDTGIGARLRKPNAFAYIIYGIVSGVVLIIVSILILIIRKVKNKTNTKKYTDKI